MEFLSYKDILIVKIKGEIDHHSLTDIKSSIDKELVKTHIKHIVLDFFEVNFMDSSGIGMIIGRYKLINDKGGRIVIININQKLRRIFDMSGLHKLIKIFDSVDAALHYLTEEVA